MIFNYGISQSYRNPHCRRKIKCEYHTIEVDVILDEWRTSDLCFANTSDLIRKHICEKHPGWLMMGYAPKQEEQDNV